MSNDKKFKSEKKGFSGSFFYFLIAAVLLVFTIQNLSSGGKTAAVSFSHQLEHLVNLDLLQKEENKKVALNDNLVTFSGRFKDWESEEGKARFRYLELLNEHHQLVDSKNDLNNEREELKQNVKDSADWFLHLSGIPIPNGGYSIVDTQVQKAKRDNVIVIKTLSERSSISLPELQQEWAAGSRDPLEFGKKLRSLIQELRSPLIGIGTEAMKQKLKDLELQTENAEVYPTLLSDLTSLVHDLDRSQDHTRLIQLRSVRNYKAVLEREESISEELEKNIALLEKSRQQVGNITWFFNNQEVSTRALEKQDSESFRQWFSAAKHEWDNFNTNKGIAFKAPDQPRNAVLERTFKSEEPAPNYFSYMLTILPVVAVVLLLYFVFSRQMKGVGSSAMTFGKAPVRMLNKDRVITTFKDVAGCDEAKEELQEIVDFLKDPTKFTALGARIPKGVLLIGSPGTGKTLIAKAVAGEADRPFFSISGSDFVEMFVGVGASRIRDLFDQARKQAPCLIFMDEIDAVGRHRGAGIGGGHDEREQTLNQLLVEMDGFDTVEGVILIAATNRPDVLDKALLRPGRFDRRIVIDLPDVKGRYEILKVHARKIKLDSCVDLMGVARNTPGSSGADLANILNEAALLAARRGRNAVTAQDLNESCDKVRYGKERRSLEIDLAEKKTTAYHESGHAIVALFVKQSDPVDKVTVIPRGMSLGATHFMPKKNRLSYWKRELHDRLAVLMGGRVAEELFVKDISSGAQMDISQATQLVRSMVCEWGMTDALGTVAYDERTENGQYLGMPSAHDKSYSEQTAENIDIEIKKIIDEAHAYAVKILTEQKDKVQLMTDMLMEFETLDREDVLEIMNGTWDTEKKRARLKSQEELHRKLPPPPPAPALSPKIEPKPQQA